MGCGASTDNGSRKEAAPSARPPSAGGRTGSVQPAPRPASAKLELAAPRSDSAHSAAAPPPPERAQEPEPSAPSTASQRPRRASSQAPDGPLERHDSARSAAGSPRTAPAAGAPSATPPPQRPDSARSATGRPQSAASARPASAQPAEPRPASAAPASPRPGSAAEQRPASAAQASSRPASAAVQPAQSRPESAAPPVASSRPASAQAQPAEQRPAAAAQTSSRPASAQQPAQPRPASAAPASSSRPASAQPSQPRPGSAAPASASRPASAQATEQRPESARPQSAASARPVSAKPASRPASAAPHAAPPALPVVPEEPPKVQILKVEDPLAAASHGVSLRGLRRLRDSIAAFLGPEAYASATTADVNARWVQTVTAEDKCRVVEDPRLVDAAEVGAPKYFISHAWSNRFATLVQSIETFLDGAADDTRVWVDLFAVNQHAGTKYQRNDIAAFKEVVRTASGGTLAVADLARCNPATRAWCLYEWANTLGTHGPESLHIQLSAAERALVVDSLDLDKAEASNPADKKGIIMDVSVQHGSTSSFNELLKLHLLLQPLSYKVDTEPLLRRAASAQWAFGPARQFVEDVSDGARVLCVMAGAGEGKSTLAAALQQAFGPNGEEAVDGCVLVHHYVKFSDQRRQEPAAIIKSLAFQLAMQLPDLRPLMLGADVARVALGRDVEGLHALLLDAPLRALLGDGEGGEGAAGVAGDATQVLVLLDGLDEADPAADAGSGSGAAAVCGNKVFQLLVNQLKGLPRTVRFIVTSRPDALGSNISRSLSASFDVPDAERRAVDFITPAQLRRGGQAGVLVYQTAAECFKDAPPPDLGGKAPQVGDLYGLYNKLFNNAGPKLAAAGAQQAVQQLLDVLLAAHEPPAQTLLQGLGLGDALQHVPGFPVLVFEEEQRVHVLHKSLTDWAGAGGGRAGPLTVEPLEGHRLLAARLLQAVRNGHRSPYALKYLVRHLVACRDVASLEAVLYDHAFLAAALGQGYGAAIVRDVVRLPQEQRTPAVQDALAWLLCQQHALAGVRGVDEVVVSGLRCPIGTLPFAVAQKAAAAAAAAGRPHQWRLVAAPGAPKAWPASRVVLEGHQANVTAAAWSADGSFLATGDAEHQVLLWDVASGERLGAFKAPKDDADNAIKGISWSKDGRTLVSGASSHSVRVWDTVSGEQRALVKTGRARNPLSFVGLSPDGRTIAVVDRVGIRLLSADSRSVVGEAQPAADFSGGEERSMDFGTAGAWSPDSKMLAVAEFHTGKLQLFDVTTPSAPNMVRRLEGIEGGVRSLRSLAWRSDGKVLAGASEARCVALWEPDTGKLLATLKFNAVVASVAWSPDGKVLATSSLDDTVRLWAGADAAKLEAKASIKAPAQTHEAINGVSFSPDGKLLCVYGANKSVRLWDVGKLLAAEAPDGQAHTDGVTCLSWSTSPAASTLATGSKDQSVKLWDGSSGACKKTLKAHSQEVLGVSWASTGELASCARDNLIKVWQDVAASDQPSWSYENKSPPQPSHTIAWAPGDRHVFVTGCWADEGCFKWAPSTWSRGAWDVEGVAAGKEVCGIAFSPEGQMVALASASGGVTLFELAGRTPTARGNLGTSGGVHSVAWSGDGKRVATGSKTGDIKLWNMEPSEPVCLAMVQGSGARVLGLDWSADGTLACGTADGDVRLFDASSGELVLLATLPGHTDAVTGVRWRPDGRMLASASLDRSIRLWQPFDVAAGSGA